GSSSAGAEADARTRTGDPFITSDGPMSAPVRSGHFRPLAEGGSLDWRGLEVTGEDNLVDGWWTSGKLSSQTTRSDETRPWLSLGLFWHATSLLLHARGPACPRHL